MNDDFQVFRFLQKKVSGNLIPETLNSFFLRLLTLVTLVKFLNSTGSINKDFLACIEWM